MNSFSKSNKKIKKIGHKHPGSARVQSKTYKKNFSLSLVAFSKKKWETWKYIHTHPLTYTYIHIYIYTQTDIHTHIHSDTYSFDTHSDIHLLRHSYTFDTYTLTHALIHSYTYLPYTLRHTCEIERKPSVNVCVPCPVSHDRNEALV